MSDQLGLLFDGQPPRRRRARPELEHYHVHGSAPTVVEAQAGEERAARQEVRLLAWWRDHPRERLTRYDAARLLRCLEVSGGRALTNLVTAGQARKRMDLHIDGPHGATCHPYELLEANP